MLYGNLAQSIYALYVPVVLFFGKILTFTKQPMRKYFRC